jgi:hypothetical protein
MRRHLTRRHRSRNWTSRSATAQGSLPTSYRTRRTIAPPAAVGYDLHTSSRHLSTRTHPRYVDRHLGGLITELDHISKRSRACALSRALTSASTLPDITTRLTIRLGHTSVVFPPRQVMHRPVNHLTALKGHRSSPEHPTEKENDGDK